MKFHTFKLHAILKPVGYTMPKFCVHEVCVQVAVMVMLAAYYDKALVCLICMELVS